MVENKGEDQVMFRGVIIGSKYRIIHPGGKQIFVSRSVLFKFSLNIQSDINTLRDMWHISN